MKQTQETSRRLSTAIEKRFGEGVALPASIPNGDELVRILEHRSHREYTDTPIDEALLRLLFACALSSSSKSDLQQADIIWIADAGRRQCIAGLIP
ncbi:MAG: nitroreductase family protein, partial [Acidiferrobacterales bacterium]